MTDAEIIKALECCFTNDFGKTNCYNCAFYTATAKCMDDMQNAVIDLINRQKAEIERLKVDLQSMRNAANSYKMHYETAKSEAIKEFAEKLKSKIWHRPECNYISSITPDYIDELVKEMMEVQK